MTFSWQDAMVLAVVAWAAGWIVRRLWLSATSAQPTGCGSGCSGCPSAKPGGAGGATTEKPFISLDSLDPRPKGKP